MKDQQDQFGSTTPNIPDRNANSQNPAATPSTTGTPRTGTSSFDGPAADGTARKVTSAPKSSGSETGFGGTQENSAAPWTDRQSENQQAHVPESKLLNTALRDGKKWVEDLGVLNSMNQLPQTLKNLGNRAVVRVSDLSTTQKVVGGTLLAVGLGWLATRKSKDKPTGSNTYNYGRQRDTNSYERSKDYQNPDASTNRQPVAGTPSRSDSGSPYGSGSRYGNGGIFSGGATATDDTSANAGIHPDGSGAGFGSASVAANRGARPADSSQGSKNDEFRSID